MKKTLRFIPASLALIIALGLPPVAPPAYAVDNIESTDAPDLTFLQDT